MKQKDQKLFLTHVLKIFTVFFISSFIMRLIGFNRFGLDITQADYIIEFMIRHRIDIFMHIIILFLNAYCILSLLSHKNNQNFIIETALITALNVALQLALTKFNLEMYYSIINMTIIFIVSCIINKRIIIKRFLLISILIVSYQLIAMFIRNVSINEIYTFFYDSLMAIDITILLGISNILKNMGGVDYKCLVAVGSFSGLRNSSKELAKKSPKQSLTKEQERLANIIFIILSLIWNIFTLISVIFVSTLNTSLITTLFILTSFMVTKSTFGEAFHMKSALACFIVSNLTYFALGKITVSINISFLIPIILGVGLSYVTSLFVRNQNIDLYKGIDEEVLRQYCYDKNLNNYQTDLLVDFYSYKMSLVKLAMKYNYAKDTIYIHKKKAVQKLKGLD